MSDSDLLRVKAANAIALGRKPDAQLPSSASWASKNPTTPIPAIPIVYNPSLPPLSATLKPPPVPRPIPVSKPQTHPLPARPPSRAKAEGVLSSTRPASLMASSESTLPISSTSTVDSPPLPSSPILTSEPTPVASSSSSPIISPLPLDPTLLNGHIHSNGIIPRPPSVPPFPEFGEGTFSFSLDMDVKGKGRALPGSGEEERSSRDFANLDGFGRGSIIDIPAVDLFSPIASTIAPSYLGSFDPFSDGGSMFDTSNSHNTSQSSRPHSPDEASPPETPDDASRRSSRFGFARRGSQGVRSGNELGSGLTRNSFAGGRESPGSLSSSSFSTSGLSLGQHRPPSSVGFSQLPPPSESRGGLDGRNSTDPATGLWPTSNSFAGPGGFPPGVFRALTSPSHSSNSSPQLSPRSRASLSYGNLPLPGIGVGAGLGGIAGLSLSSGITTTGPPPGVGLSIPVTSLPPGLSLNRTPIPAASFPLPPPAPRASGQSTPVGKEDLLALIAAAQAAPKSLHNPGKFWVISISRRFNSNLHCTL